MNDKFSLISAAIVTVAVAAAASTATFFITKRVLAKKPNIPTNQTSLQKNENTHQNIESDVSTIKSEINSIKNDIETIKSNSIQKKTPKKPTTKNTNDAQNNRQKKWSFNENDENTKSFNKIFIDLQQEHLSEQHHKNLEYITSFLSNAYSTNPVTHKTNDNPFQDILIEDYYETESSKVRTIFLPAKTNNINKFCKNMREGLNKRIDPLKEINFGNEIKKENTHHIKKAIDAYCLKKEFKTIINESLVYAKVNHKEIAGFFISEYKLQNHTNSYNVSTLYY